MRWNKKLIKDDLLRDKGNRYTDTDDDSQMYLIVAAEVRYAEDD